MLMLCGLTCSKRHNLAAQMEALVRGDKVWDVRVACLGEDPENEYFFNLIEKDGGARSGTNFYYGN